MSSLNRLSLLCCLIAGCGGGAPEAQKEALKSLERTKPAPALKARLELPCRGKPDGVLLLDPSLGVGPLVAVTHDPGELLIWEDLPSSWSLSPKPRRIAIPDWCLGPALLPGGVVPSIALADRSEPGLLVVDSRSGERTARVDLEHRPRALSVGDPDADRVDEIVCVDASGALLMWRPGELVERIEGDPADGLLPTCVMTATDSSGVVVGQQASRSLRLFRRQEPDGPLAPAESVELGEIPRSLVEIEVDGDPAPELAVAMGDHSVRLFGVGVRVAHRERPGAVLEADSRRALSAPRVDHEEPWLAPVSEGDGGDDAAGQERRTEAPVGDRDLSGLRGERPARRQVFPEEELAWIMGDGDEGSDAQGGIEEQDSVGLPLARELQACLQGRGMHRPLWRQGGLF